MNALVSHLVVVPILLPLVTAALMVALGERRRRLKALLNVAATAAGLAVAVALLARADDGTIGVYLVGNWQAPFGIALVADRLATLMLVVVGVTGLGAALYAEGAWSRAGVHFHPLFQLQLMGLNGAFLTGDLFNLFVFFEVMLAASYGLELHGSGGPRVRSGLHYIAVNLLASALFLIGLAVLYGVLGTLSMADIAIKLAQVPEGDRGLLHAGAAILAVAFLIKAAAWPLNAWLAPAYTAASAPVSALFAVMTKVGIYALLRLWTLLFLGEGPSAHFGQSVLLYGGLATVAVGALGLVGSMRLDRIAAYSIVVSSGTLLASLGVGSAAMTAAALFYLVSATVAVSALFLLVELLGRARAGTTPPLRDVELVAGEDTNLDDLEAPLVGRAFPVSMALLGLTFMACALIVAGLPPLSGFIAKLSLLTALLAGAAGGDGGDSGALAPSHWVLFGLLLVAGFAATLSLARAGVRYLWTRGARPAPELGATEVAAVVTLLGTCVLLTAFAQPVLRYTTAAAAGLHAPRPYLDAVLSTPALPRAGSPAPSTPPAPEPAP